MLSGITQSNGDFSDLIRQVKVSVDVHKLLPNDPEEEQFSRYWRRKCINPDHTDNSPSMLVYQDGVFCSACGFKADALDLYQAFNPNTALVEATTALLSNEGLQFEGEVAYVHTSRQLDDSKVALAHLRLFEDKQALAGLHYYGVIPAAIHKFQLGFTEVLGRLLPEELDLAETADRIEWREIKGRQIPYQRQNRYSCPVFDEGGKLRQVIYRKADKGDLGAKVQLEYSCGPQLFGIEDIPFAKKVIICEGWADKIMFYQWGFTRENGWAVVCSTNGAGHWCDEWTELLGGITKIYFSGDADNAGKRLEARLKRALPWGVQLPTPYPLGTKKDWRDYWLEGKRRSDVDKLIKNASLTAVQMLFSKG